MAFTPGESSRVQVIFQGPSGLPEDRFVNTFHGTTHVDFAGPQYQDEIFEAIKNFYIEPVAATASAVSSWLAGGVTGGEVRLYDMETPEPRVPVTRVMGPEWIAQRGALGDSLPFEVAACISWGTAVNGPKPGVPGKRGRGRTFLGPLRKSAAEVKGPGIALADQARLTFAHAAQALIARTGWQLQVYSPTYNVFDQVIKGHVDNALDTQRRRGTKATNRYTFNLAGVGSDAVET